MLMEELARRLNESELSVNSIFNNEITAMCILEFDTLKFLEVNDAFCLLYNYYKEEFHSGMTVHDVTVENDVSVSSIYQIQKKGSIFIPLGYHKKKDGTVFQTEIIAYNYTWKGKEGILAIISDITELSRQVEDLFISTQKHRMLFEFMPQGVIYYNSDGKIISANPAAERILGFTTNEMVGKTYFNSAWKLIRDDGSELSQNEHPIKVALHTGCPVVGFILGISNLEREINLWLSITAIPLLNIGESKPFQIYSTFEDITNQKRVETALRESEEKFYKAFHFSPVAMSLSTLEGVILDVNDEFLRLAERTRDEVVGNNTLELNSWVHPEQRDFIISKVRNSGKVQNVEVELRSKSSKIIPLLFAAEIVVIARKEYLLFSALNISTRKAAEEKINKLNEELEKRVNERTEELFKTNLNLQQSELKYRTIVDFTHDWEYWISAEGNYNYVSPSCEKITGYAVQEFLDDNNLLNKITHPDDLDFLVKTSNAKLLPKDSCEFEFRIITKSGDVRWISHVCQLVFGRDGEFLGKRGSNRDITERKAVEDELKLYKDHLIELVEIKTAELEKSKETFRALSENSNDAIIRFNKKLQHLYVNKATEELTGIPVKEFIGKTFSDFDFPPKLVKNFETSILSVFQLKKKDRIELKLPNGVWIDWLLMPEFDSNGDVDSVISSGRDITERKQMQLSLQKNFKKEHELNELKDRFISMVSHEFRTPLTSILSSSDILEMEIENMATAQKTKYFDKIRRNVEHMINMLNEILFINKIDSSKIHQNYEKIDLPQFCEELFNESKIIYPGINSIVENKLEERFHNIDAVMMRNILGNLFSNAFKYNQENGTVIFTLSLEKDRLIYNVCDTGIGIPLEEQKNVFESFTRMSNARHIKGTGLGLSIVKKSVEQLEGKISFTSKENEGSRFIVTIPIR